MHGDREFSQASCAANFQNAFELVPPQTRPPQNDNVHPISRSGFRLQNEKARPHTLPAPGKSLHATGFPHTPGDSANQAPQDKSNRSIFGDGAAACLISTSGLFEIANFSLGTDGAGAENLILRTGASRSPQKNNTSEIDDDGHIQHDDYLYMNGNAIFNFTLKTVPDIIRDTLKVNNISNNEVDYFIFHQANKFMLDTIRKICKIPQNKFYNNMQYTGNTVSSTVFIALKDCLDNGTIFSGMKIMISGFGVGLSYGACILQ